MLCLHSEHILLHEIDGTFEILQSRSFGTIMGMGDEDLDVRFVVREEWMDVRLVDESSALGLWEYEVGEEEEAEICVEWEPGDHEEGPVLHEGEAGYDDPVHEPWSQLGGVGGAEGFVGGEDGEEDG